MTVQQWLDRGFKVNREINELKQAKDNAKQIADENSKEYKEYSKLLFKRIDELLEINKQTVEAVSKMDDILLRTVFTARYINCKTWEEIADDLELTIRWVYRLRKKGIEELEKKLDITT